MNNPETTTNEEVFVFINHTETSGLKKREPALFFTPSMRLFASPTTFLRERYTQSGRSPSPNTWANIAYALAGWFNFLFEIDVDDWRRASRDDLIAYRDVYSQAVSPKTGHPYATGTIAGRMAAILGFYKFAGQRCWYDGDILGEPESRQPTGGVGLATPASADTRNVHCMRTLADLMPRRRPSRSAVRPFFDAELRAFLSALGPRASERGNGDARPCRDRLIGDIGVFVGLRNDEIHQLTKYQFLTMHPDAEAPLADQRLTITGKGQVARTVAIPNWLALDVLAYIDGERAQAARAGRQTGRKEAPDLFLAGVESNAPGRPLTHRRFQQVVEEACLRAGIIRIVSRIDPETGAVTEVKKAKHCVHDLRHTYAVLTYWAEKMGGNAEPWKKIQAQLGHRHLNTTINTYLCYVDIFGKRERLIDVHKLIGL
ncbi:tyrosine-type recombinase/integrase [Azospirillum himalayense]|uniref:Tyrosine-type recombinase/integrase n=1 Tax=Azospirillum himalayense TaxID=654847 RepID=A0ABW0G5N0_9PROT